MNEEQLKNETGEIREELKDQELKEEISRLERIEAGTDLMQDDAEKSPARSEVFTIPNVMTFFRIILIPVFMYLFMTDRLWPAIGVLLLSGLSDVLDGFIARKFNMVSDLGIALDPIADKLTQFAVMLCLVFRFPSMLVPLLLIVIKEVVTGIFALLTIRRSGLVKGARWYGKVTTVLLYVMMGLHIIWPLLHGIWPETFRSPELPQTISIVSIVLCCVMMVFSFVMYVRRYVLMLKVIETEKEEKQDGE
ncbi:MAG: CDP-alcohol phosphatidyltransferase family protein [Treponema sp.]|nr:CDP-alcohol phosphatidyltransferase family protein [Treponema sp.]